MTIQSNIAPPATKPPNAGQSVASKVQTSQAQSNLDLGAPSESGFPGLLMSMGEEVQVDVPPGEPLKAPVDLQQQVIAQDKFVPDWVLNPVDQSNMAKPLVKIDFIAIKIDASAPAPISTSLPSLKPASVINSVPSLSPDPLDSTALITDGATQGLSKQFSKNMGLAKMSVKSNTSVDALSSAATTTGQMLDAKDFKTHQLLDFSHLMRQQTEAVTVAAAKESDVFKTDRASDKLSVKSFASGTEGNAGYQAVGGTARSDSVSATYSVSTASPEMAVAEQVSYWISQDVQRAELKLDGPGQDPVEVSIFVRGNEASVEFRSDQPETRQVLEGAVAHLKDLLRGEGMVLSGVSVGSSGHNGTGTKQQQNGQGRHFSNGDDMDQAKVSLQLRSDRSTGHALDLFV